MDFINKIRPKLLAKEIDGQLVTFINPFSYLILRRTGILDQMDKIYVDGIFLVLMFRVIGIKVNRVSFDMTSLAPIVFEKASAQKKMFYFVGAKPGEIKNFATKIKERFEDMRIVGFRNGYFNSEMERQKCIVEIVQSTPDIIVAGMGSPAQEKFIADLRKAGYSGTAYTCGGFLHQTSRGITYYPKWIDKLNLRWLYRFFDERRVFVRTLQTYPKFFWVFMCDIFKG